MSTIQKITQLSHRIFNTSVTEQNVARTSNPFAASNFQKNILTEDVYESSNSSGGNKVSFTGNINAGTKRIYSTFVGALGNIGNRFSEGIESIAAFCGRMKDSIVNTWNKVCEIGNTEISLSGAKDVLSRDITSFFVGGHERTIGKLAKMDPNTEIKPMFAQYVQALEADMAAVA